MSRILHFYFSVALFLISSSISLASPFDDCGRHLSIQSSSKKIRLNTSNLAKQNDYLAIFQSAGRSIVTSGIDLHEIDSDPVEVITHKASQFHDLNEIVLVEDTSLDIEGFEIGANLKWFVDRLDQFVGQKALLRMMIAYRNEQNVLIFTYEAWGRIESPRIPGRGLNSYFIPDGSNLTLAESGEIFEMRRTLIHRLLNHDQPMIRPVIEAWNGNWQPYH